MSGDYSDRVHETDGGRWVVAQWVERSACYVAPMTREAMRLTGCSQVSSRSVDGLRRDPCVQVYRNRASALRAARREYDGEDES